MLRQCAIVQKGGGKRRWNGNVLAIDLFCGLGGWAEGFLAEGYDVIGFDIERRPYPAQLVLQDVLTIHGSQFKDAAVIVASPPCQAYSYRAMPWGALWLENARMDDDGAPSGNYRGKDPIFNDLFRACFRIQREAIAAAGRGIPMVVENVKGAQKWVGPARAHFGSFYLWGDIDSVGGSVVAGGVRFGNVLRAARRSRKPDELPELNGHDDPKRGRSTNGSWFAIGADGKSNLRSTKNDGGSWFNIAHNTESGRGQNSDGRKVPGIELSKVGFNCAAAQRFRLEQEGVKQTGSGPAWFDKALDERRKQASTIKNRKDRPDYPYSPGDSRKRASAEIAKIPFHLARHIAACFKPV